MHELSPEKLKTRDVVHIDIANDTVSTADYKPLEDPTKYLKIHFFFGNFKANLINFVF